MKLFQLISYLFFSAFFVYAAEDTQSFSASNLDSDEVDGRVDSNIETQEEPQYVNIDVSYDILEKTALNFDAQTEFAADEFATFNFTLKNNEAYNITVFGISGKVISNPEGYHVANISERIVGPYEVPVNGTLHFQTAVQLILPEGSFYLAPLVSITRDEEPIRLGIRPLSIFVSPPPMSFFNPAFLSVQIILGLFIVGLSIPLLNYLKADVKKGKKKLKQKTVDETWLPEAHKR